MSTYNCRGAINGIIVQNNPVNFVDPLGLANYFTDRYGKQTWTVSLDTAIAGGRIALGRATIGLGIGLAIGTVVEDVATFGVGVWNDAFTIGGAVTAIAEGSRLFYIGISDLKDLYKINSNDDLVNDIGSDACGGKTEPNPIPIPPNTGHYPYFPVE